MRQNYEDANHALNTEECEIALFSHFEEKFFSLKILRIATINLESYALTRA